jgi:protein SCO1/2
VIRVLIVLVLAVACGSSEPPAAVGSAAPLPPDSLYRLEVALVDHRGNSVDLAVHRGHPTIVSMFYTSCPAACPLLIEDIRALEARLPEADRADLRVLLVSLDPAHDTPEAMARVIERRGVDGERWVLARPRPEDVRPVAAVLGISYRPTADGEMDHSSILTLVDVDGRVVARLEGVRQDPSTLIQAIARARRVRE